MLVMGYQINLNSQSVRLRLSHKKLVEISG